MMMSLMRSGSGGSKIDDISKYVMFCIDFSPMQNMAVIMSISEIIKLDGAMLASFCVVAEELNFARAAARLCISQPPLSRRIRQLEQLVGTDLFVRTTRSVKLTPAGALMYDHARKVCNEMASMLDDVREMARGEGGKLSIGITPSAACSPLVSVLHAFRHAHPRVALDLREMDSVLLSEELLHGRVDIALMRPVAAHASIKMTVVHNEPMGFITRKENAYAGSQVTMSQILRHPLIGYDTTSSPYLHQLMHDLLKGTDAIARIVQYSRLPSILTLIEAGVGAAIVPQSMMHVRSDLLHFHRIEPAAGPTAQIVVATQKHVRHPAALALTAAFLAHMQNGDIAQ